MLLKFDGRDAVGDGAKVWLTFLQQGERLTEQYQRVLLLCSEVVKGRLRRCHEVFQRMMELDGAADVTRDQWQAVKPAYRSVLAAMRSAMRAELGIERRSYLRRWLHSKIVEREMTKIPRRNWDPEGTLRPFIETAGDGSEQLVWTGGESESPAAGSASSDAPAVPPDGRAQPSTTPDH